MPSLVPELALQLRIALVEAFDPPALEMLARFRLGARLDILIDPVGSTPELVSRLLERVEQGGWTEELIRGAFEETPKAPLLLAYCQAHAPFVFTPRKATADLARAMADGLTRLTVGLGGVPVRLTGEAKGHLRRLTPGFARLRDYKALHDCLHNLQFKYVREISMGLRAVAKDPNDPAASDLPIFFNEADDSLRRVEPNAASLGDLEKMWLKIALQAVARLRDGVRRNDLTTAEGGLKLLGHQLRLQPTRINQALTDSLEGLPFGELLQAFRSLSAQFPAGSGSAAALTDVTAALGSLVPRLNRDLGDHHDWQLIDNSLVQIDSELKGEAAADICSILWEGADSVLGPMLVAAREERWAVELRTLGAALVQAMTAGVPNGVRLAFGPVRARAGMRFYLVDSGLRDLTGDLVAIGNQLDLLLQVIGDGG